MFIMKHILTIREKEVENKKNYNKRAFTLAEVLMTLGIIGVVAVMTIPNLVTDIQEKEWATASDTFICICTGYCVDIPMKFRFFYLNTIHRTIFNADRTSRARIRIDPWFLFNFHFQPPPAGDNRTTSSPSFNLQ